MAGLLHFPVVGDMVSGKDPVNIGNIRGLAERAIREGMSQRRFVTAMREAGAQATRQSVRDVFNDVRSSMLYAGDVRALPYNRIPDAGSYSPWQAGRAGRYAYQVKMALTDAGTGITVDRQFTVISDDPISITNAINQAIAIVEAGLQSGAYDDETVDSATIENLYVTV